MIPGILVGVALLAVCAFAVRGRLVRVYRFHNLFRRDRIVSNFR